MQPLIQQPPTTVDGGATSLPPPTTATYVPASAAVGPPFQWVRPPGVMGVAMARKPRGERRGPSPETLAARRRGGVVGVAEERAPSERHVAEPLGKLRRARWITACLSWRRPSRPGSRM